MTRLSYLQQIVQWHDFQNVTLTTCLQTLWRKHCLTSNTTNYRQLWFTIRRYYIQHSLRLTDRGSGPKTVPLVVLSEYTIYLVQWRRIERKVFRHGTEQRCMALILYISFGYSICGTGGIFLEQSTRPTIRNLLDRRFWYNILVQ